jgi:hypothetical protein
MLGDVGVGDFKLGEDQISTGIGCGSQIGVLQYV